MLLVFTTPTAAGIDRKVTFSMLGLDMGAGQGGLLILNAGINA